MSFNKILTTAVMTASIAAGSLIPMSTAANAGHWHKNRGGHGVERAYGGGGWMNHRRYGGYDNDYGYRRHHDNTGRNLAIGAFVTILGIALAAEAGRVHHDYYDERD